MEIKEGIMSFAEKIIPWQTHAQTLWAFDFPREQNGAVLPNKTRANYKGELRAGNSSSHSTGVILQRQPSLQLAGLKYGESPAGIGVHKVSSAIQVIQPPQTDSAAAP